MLSLYCTHHHSSVHTLTQSPLEMRSAFRSSFIFLEFFLSLSRTYLNESSRNPVSELKFIMFEKMARSGTKISQNLALFTICVPFFFWHAGPPTVEGRHVIISKEEKPEPPNPPTWTKVRRTKKHHKRKHTHTHTHTTNENLHRINTKKRR